VACKKKRSKFSLNVGNSKAMRILHWYPNFLGGGGVANAVLGLAKAQAELGAEVAIACAVTQGKPLYQPMENLLGNVQISRWLPKWKFKFGNLMWRQIPKESIEQMRKFNPDVVHVHGEFNPDNWHVPKIFNAPIILSPHGAFHPVVLKKSKPKVKALYVRVAKRFLYRHVYAFHALSPAEEGHIQALLGHVNVYTVPQGASLHAQSFDTLNYREQSNGKIRFVFVGRLDIYTKGLDILLEAFAEAAQALPERNIHLTLVGPDWKGSLVRLKEVAYKLGCGNRVTFTGAKPGEQVAKILTESDVYVHLSRHEGFPLSITEALLASNPAILSKEIGLVSYLEIASLPHVKVIFPEKEEAVSAIVQFVEKLLELKTLATAHQEKVRRFFDWREIAKEHLECYEHIVRNY
jgi:glycosyltransferase involved in cell wall biosynthesis